MHLISTKTGNLRNVNMYFAPFILHTSSNYKSVILSVPKFTADAVQFAVYVWTLSTRLQRHLIH